MERNQLNEFKLVAIETENMGRDDRAKDWENAKGNAKEQREGEAGEWTVDFSLGFLKPYKKYIYGAAVALGFVGVIFALVIGLALNSVVDKAERAAIPQIDNLANTFGAIEGSVSAVETEAETLNGTIGRLKEPLGSIGKIADSISSISALLGINGNESKNLGKSVNDIATDIPKHQQNIGQFRESIGSLKSSLGAQKDAILKAKTDVSSTFGSMKLVAMLGSLALILMFGILILVGLGGLTE